MSGVNLLQVERIMHATIIFAGHRGRKTQPGVGFRGLGTLHPKTGRRFKGVSKEFGLFEDHAPRVIDPEDCSQSPT